MKVKREIIQMREKVAHLEAQLKSSEEKRHMMTKTYIKEENYRKQTSKLANMPLSEQQDHIRG